MRHRVQSPIVTSKHLIQQTVFTIAAAGINNVVIAKAVDIPAAGVFNEVKVGSVIKAVWVEMWLSSDDASLSSVSVNFEKKVASTALQSFTNATTLHPYTNKSNVLYVTQGLVGSNVQNGVPFLRSWIKIPKGKQRMGLNDQLVLNIAAITNGIFACGVQIYKEYQ